ncbi:MAG: DUF932 domain-containing protein, partial [Eubacteriales bacterium]|nr:DUF932 domain-containing protein [Eubacteriales bacterium]
YVREKPWHGLGTRVIEAPNSEDALILAGLNWNVLQEPIRVGINKLIPGYKANIRDIDHKVLGIVTDRYKVIQNQQAFAFTDELLGEGVQYETAGSLQGGKKVWLLARMPQEYLVAGEQVSPYLIFRNSHDGSGAVKVAMTPIRVVCNNTLNLALNTANRVWSVKHVGEIKDKLAEARDTLLLADTYMRCFGNEVEELRKKRLTDQQVEKYIDLLLPIEDNASLVRQRNVRRLKDDLKIRYFDAPDLQDVGKNAYRFINAVSDFATHTAPLRRTANYQENLFAKTMEGNPMIDKAYAMMKAV